MRASFSAIVVPPPRLPQLLKQPRFHPHPHHHRVPCSASLWTSRIRRIVRVLEEATEVETAALGNADGEEIETGINGFAVETVEAARDSPPKVLRRRKKMALEEDDSSDRFKLRNGREVFEEKAYLVGVDCRGKEDVIFSTEDSLKELAQLADTAGLLVVGSTSQNSIHNLMEAS